MFEKPDMNPVCADFIIELAKKADVILEWGSGGSTVCMSNVLPEGSVLYSMEHDSKFYNMIGPKLKNNVEYVLAKTVDAYVEWPPAEQHYSFILVDTSEKYVGDPNIIPSEFIILAIYSFILSSV